MIAKISNILFRSKIFQCKDSKFIYLLMVFFAKAYELLFIGQNHVVLPTIWGARLIITKNSSIGSGKWYMIITQSTVYT